MQKTILALAVCLLTTFNSHSQDLGKSKALLLLQNNKELLNIKLEGNDVAKITNAYTDERLGLTYVYIQQNYKDIKVFNTIKTTVFKQDILQSQAGDFITNIATKANSETPVVTASNAINLAAAHLGLHTPQNLSILENTLSTNKQIKFSAAGIAKKSITAELVWRSIDDDKSLQLAWNISMDVLNSADYWNVRVDAASGNILDKDNYTVYEHNTKQPTKTIAPKKNENTNTNEVADAQHSIFDAATTSASYRVIAYPKENKNAGVTLETNPWLKAGAGNNATTNGWHYDGVDDYNYTRGNNVYAYDDSAAANTPGRSSISSTAIPTLTFNTIPNFARQPTIAINREFATTNLFYWNNILHDVTYQYGFTEAAGNFQYYNLGRGGAEGDQVNAESQDGGGINNANFSAPPDGISGRMQMYLFNTAAIKLDGDADNGIISHEYGHGISIRLTGGPANSSCLNNYEQAGEGWSDYIALMMTTNWATAQLTDGTKRRPMGNFVLNQSVNGNGIRTFPYSTDMNVNPHTYLNVGDTAGNPQTNNAGVRILNATEIHFVGEVWCAAIWDMTWNIIQQVGHIDSNLYNANGTGGNVIAYNLVMQGLKMQKCSPGFLDSRNAILKADSIIYGGKYRCAIWTAFAGRGMGISAIQGVSTKTTDQVEAFDVAPLLAAPTFTNSSTSVLAGQTGVAYACSVVAGARSYQWVYSGTGATITGNGSSVTISFAANATSGNLSVATVNATGCSGSTESIAITVTSLPIVLSSFTAQKNNNTAILKWTTKTETNNKNFEVQRSIDGINFSSIGSVEAKGNSSFTNNYTFTDTKPFIGTNFYRLKQIDFNGKYTVSNIQTVTFANNGELVVRIYPNPVKEVLNVLATNGKITEIKIVNNQGKRVYQTLSVSTDKPHQIQLNTMAAGTYFIEISSAKSTVVEKFIKN